MFKSSFSISEVIWTADVLMPLLVDYYLTYFLKICSFKCNQILSVNQSNVGCIKPRYIAKFLNLCMFKLNSVILYHSILSNRNIVTHCKYCIIFIGSIILNYTIFILFYLCTKWDYKINLQQILFFPKSKQLKITVLKNIHNSWISFKNIFISHLTLILCVTPVLKWLLLIILIAFVFIIAYFLEIKCTLYMYCPQYHLLFKIPDIISSTMCNPMHEFHSILNVILFSVFLCLHCCNKENWGKPLLYVFSLLLVQTFSVLCVFISNLIRFNISV